MVSLFVICFMIGMNDDDVFIGIRYFDVMFGWFGDDFMFGYNGNDEVWGGIGDDMFYGNNGNDKFYGFGGLNFVQIILVEIIDDYLVFVVFEGEMVGYWNIFGYYKVVEDGMIQDVEIIWLNVL